MKKLALLLLILLAIMASCTHQKLDNFIFSTLVSTEEVSDLVLFNKLIYAGGVNGLYAIDPTSHTLHKTYHDRFTTVKDLMVHDGYLYIAHDRGLTRFNGSDFENLTYGNETIEDFRVNCLLIDTDLRLWIGTYKGIYVNEDLLTSGELTEAVTRYAIWTNLNSRNELIHDTVFSLFQDSNGGIWIGHYASPGGISYTFDNHWTYFTVEQGLPHTHITGFFEADSGLYASTGFYSDGGLALFNPLAGAPVLTDTLINDWGPEGSKVRSISVKDSTLFIGTEYDGLYVIDGTHQKLYTTKDGLSNNEIKSILYYQDEIWLGTRSGISYTVTDLLIDDQ